MTAVVLSLAYGAWVLVGFAMTSATPILTVALAAISLPLSLLILARQRFDLLSPAFVLLLFGQLYFAARFDLSSGRFGTWHAFEFMCYDLYLLGVYLGLRLEVFCGQASRAVTCHATVAPRPRVLALTTLCFIAYVLLVWHLLRATNDSLDPVTLLVRSLATRLALADQGLSPILLLSGLFSSLGITGAFVLSNRYRFRGPLILWLCTIAASSMALGSRGQIVIPVFQVLIAAAVCARHPMRLLLWAVPPLVAITLAFSTWYLSVREGGDGNLDEYSIFDRFDAFQNWMGALEILGLEIAPARSVPDALLQFVPRSLFPEKPYYFSTEMTRRAFPTAFGLGINFDFGGIAESVHNFFLLGPVLFGMFLGWLCTILNRLRNAARQKSSPIVGSIYAQGLLIPPSYFFIGWINASMIFVLLGYLFLVLLSVRMFSARFQRVTSKHVLRRMTISTAGEAA